MGHDPRLVIRVAGLKKLGSNSEVIVRDYFEQKYGPVDALLLANSPTARSVMGFVLMRAVDDAQRAIADGEFHEVLPGAAVKLRAFERRPGFSGARSGFGRNSFEGQPLAEQDERQGDASNKPHTELVLPDGLQVIARWGF